MYALRQENALYQVKIWERLQLAVGEPGKEGFYTCRVIDVADDCIVIDRPIFDRGHSLLANGRVVSANFTRVDAAYSFSARLRELSPKSPVKMLLTETSTVHRLQRRRYVRIEKAIMLKYAVIKRPIAERLEIEFDQIEDSVYSLNISAGGLAITIKEKLPDGAILLLDFTRADLIKLPEYMLAICRHVRTDENKQLIAGLEFMLNEDLRQFFEVKEIKLIPELYTNFSIHTQNELTSELFSEQLALRQKGLL